MQPVRSVLRVAHMNFAKTTPLRKRAKVISLLGGLHPNGRGDMDHRAGRPHSGPRRISDAAPSDPGAWPTVKPRPPVLGPAGEPVCPGRVSHTSFGWGSAPPPQYLVGGQGPLPVTPNDTSGPVSGPIRGPDCAIEPVRIVPTNPSSQRSASLTPNLSELCQSTGSGVIAPPHLRLGVLAFIAYSAMGGAWRNAGAGA